MEETVVKKKTPKLLIILVVTALVILGGSASAFFLLTKSPKVQYFLAESETFKQMGSLFEDRYKNEVNWIEVQSKKPVETTYDLSAEWNDPSVNYEMQEFQNILNSVTLTMKQVHDPVNKELEVEFSGALGKSITVNFGSLFVTAEKLLLELPFTNDLIRFDDKDFGKLMREFDEDYDGNENLGLSQLFEDSFSMTEEFRTYIAKEYLEYLYKGIPDEAFTSEKEDIVVFDKNIKAKKVMMDLSEEDVKALLKDLLKKARSDEKLKAILKEQFTLSSFAGDISNSDVKTMLQDFEDGLDEAIEEVDSISIPNGLQSIIWLDSDLIVKREFSIGVGEDKDDVATLTISGTQLLEKTNQQWDYTIGATDSFGDEEAVNIKGDLTWKDQKADDTITLTMEEIKFVYKGKEDLKDNKRTFTRSFGLKDGEIDPAVIWSGTVTHEEDSINANHELTISDNNFGENPLNLILKQQGKVVKKVDLPEETDSTVNIGQMSIDEIEKYFTSELNVESWLSGLMGDIEEVLYGN